MTYDVNATMRQEMSKVEGAFPIDMYVINASPTGTDYLYYVNQNQDVVGYQLNASGEVINSTTLYNAVYSERGDLSSNIEAEITSVSISIPNVDRSIESIIQHNNYLRGCEVYIISTFAKHLPSGSGANYVGSDPDYRACLKEKFYIDSVTSNEESVTFDAKSKFDIRNIVLPGRTYSVECQWALRGYYRETECDPNGNISATTFPDCDGTLENCRERDNSERYGGFISIPKRGFVVL
jgi:lambda family phage minor tail protein L